MPTPDPTLVISRNGGSFTTGAVTCTASNTIRLRLATTAGVGSPRFELYGYPAGWTTPAGWTLDAINRVIFCEALEPPDFTLPASLWGKWFLRSIVDGVYIDDGVSALEILGPGGLHALPACESTQFGGRAEQWGKHLEENLRILAAGGGGGGGPSLSDANPVDVQDEGPDPGVSPLASRADHRHAITPAAVVDALSNASTDISAGGNRIVSLDLPVDPSDAATRGYADSLSENATSYSIAGSGAATLLAATWAYTVLALTGALTGDRPLTLANAPGRRSLFINRTSGIHLGWVQILGPGGGSTYLAPGQAKWLHLDQAGVLCGEDLALWRCTLDFSATAGGAGSVVAASVALPPGMTLSPVRGRTTTSVVAASAPPSIKVGFGGVGTDEVMKLTGVPTSAGTGFGGATTSLGSSADDLGQVDSATTQTVSVTVVNAGVCSAGAARLRLFGEVLS